MVSLDAMKILFSSSANQTFEVPQGSWRGHHIDAVARPSEWGLTGLRKKLFHLICAWDVAWRARRYEALALCTVGIEAFFIGRLRRALCPKTRVVCADPLIPRPGRGDALLGRQLRGIDALVLIRRGDTWTMEQRFDYPATRCHFAYFPVARALPAAQNDGDYLYAAGNAHRDWQTLLEALELAPHRAILSPGEAIQVPSALRDRIELRPGLSPAQGRELLRNARFVVMPFAETPLPSGPLVLLDAMGMGKAVAVTQVNGSRDYVSDGETALVVPPGDAPALASAIARLAEDGGLRHNLGETARHQSHARFDNDEFIAAIIAQCAT